MKSLFPLVLIVFSALLNGQTTSITIHEGSGEFWVKPGRAKSIQVHYHKPSGFHADSPILLVIPGAGRNGDQYRDAWVAASEKFGVLVLSPVYPEADYDFGMYHMGGVMKNFALRQSPRVEPTPNGRVLFADDEDFAYDVNLDRETWLFRDFDGIFATARDAVGAKATAYDIFGHSAGGQILHRLALFYPETQANRILASNSGFYTLPSPEFGLPFGVSEFAMKDDQLARALGKNLILFLGELDNADETRGTLLRTPKADRQGLHRLERAYHCIAVADTLAARLGVQHNWAIEVVPGVGHDYRKMSLAAAQYLYGPPVK